MKITQSNVSLFSSHQKNTQITEKESLEKWSTFQDAPERFKNMDRLELTQKFKSLNNAKASAQIRDGRENEELDPKLMRIILAIEALTGKKIDLSFMKRHTASENSAQPALQGWGIDYSYEKSEVQEESLKFSA